MQLRPHRSAQLQHVGACWIEIECTATLSRAFVWYSGPDGSDGGARGPVGAMTAIPAGVQIWLASGGPDLRRGFGPSPAALVEHQLLENPFDGQCSSFEEDAGIF